MTLRQAMRKAYGSLCDDLFALMMEGKEGTEQYKELEEAAKELGDELGITEEEGSEIC